MERYDGEIDEDVVSVVSEESYHSVHSNPSVEVDDQSAQSASSIVDPSAHTASGGSTSSVVDPSTILDSHDASDGSDNSLDLEDDVDTEQARRT